MKHTLTVIISVSVGAAMMAAGCSRDIQEKTSDLVLFGLGSQACKTVKVTCDTSFNKFLEDNYVAHFDSTGKLTTLRTLDTEGSTMNIEVYEYDPEGRLAQIILLDRDSSSTGRYHYEYDGKFISKCTLYGMNNQDSQTWIHSNDGKHIVKTEFFQEGELQTVSKSKWSHKGKVREETVTDGEGELVGKSEYIYLSPDKPSSINTDLIDIVIKYDGNGLPVSSEDVFVSSKGDLIPSEKDEPDGAAAIYNYEYTYDSLGRWITRKTTLDGDTVYEIITRTIE